MSDTSSPTRHVGRPLPPSASAVRLGSAPQQSLVGLDRPAEIAGYEILGELGRGGMGVVYKAKQQGLGRVVALKMILGARFAHPEDLMRFRLEAETAAALQHPNIVQVHEVGTFQDQPFMVLEYVAGGSLAARLKDGLLPVEESVAVVETLARAAHAAHLRGIVHRDLKPGNVLLGEDGSPRISDFGLAKHLDRAGMTETGRVLGTPDYMAPEQATGRTHEIGPATDIYALGVILYEMLVGHTPFATDGNVAAMLKSLHTDPPSLRRLKPQISRDLETICLKCLEKEPARRYASALALAEDLQRFQEGRSVQARPASVGERLLKWCRRRPLIAGLLAGLVLVTLLGFAGVSAALVYALRGWGEAQEQRQRAEDEQEEAQKQGREAVAQRKHADEQRRRADGEALAAKQAQAKEARERQRAEASLSFSRMAQARLEWRLNDVGASASLLRQVPAERRGWEWRYLHSLLHGDLMTLDWDDTIHVYSLTYSPDGRHLVVAGGNPYSMDDYVAELRDSRTGEFLNRLNNLKGLPTAVAFSADGKALAVASQDGMIHVAEMPTGRTLNRFDAGMGPLTSLVWSPDGTRLYASSVRGRIAGYDPRQARRVMLALQGSAKVPRISLSPCGRWLATSGDAAQVIDTASGRSIHAVPYNGSKAVAFSPDGRHVAFAQGPRVWLHRAGTWQKLHPLVGHDGDVTDLAFSPDGLTVCTVAADRTVRLWDADDGRQQSIWRGHEGRLSAVAFHPGGGLVATGSAQPGEIKVWDLTRRQQYLPLAAPQFERGVEALGFTDDGKHVLIQRRAQTLERRDPATGLTAGMEPMSLPDVLRVPGRLAAISASGGIVAGRLLNSEGVGVWDRVGRSFMPWVYPHTGPVCFVACDREGRRVASQSHPGRAEGKAELAVWEPATGKVRLSITAEERIAALAISPDGRRLARAVIGLVPQTNGNGQTLLRPQPPELRIHEVDGKGVVRVKLPQVRVTALAFRGDGQMLALAAADGLLRLYDPRTGEPMGKPLRGSERVEGMAFHPEGRLLAGVSRVCVRIWDVQAGEEVLLLRGAEPRTVDWAQNPSVAWSPDGQRLVASNWDHSVSLWDGGDRTTPASRAGAKASALARMPSWRIEQVRAAQKRDRRGAMRFHLARLEGAELSPAQRLERGELLGQIGAWDRACTDMKAASEGLEDVACKARWQLSMLLAHGGDTAAHRLHASRLLARFGLVHDGSEIAEALMGSALPEGPAREGLAAAERKLASHVGHHSMRGMQHSALALARLRLGRSLEEIAAAVRAAAAEPSWARVAPSDAVILALACHRDGKREEALRHLRLADAWLEGERAKLASSGETVPTGMEWADWLRVLMLHRQAERKLRPGTLRMPRLE